MGADGTAEREATPVADEGVDRAAPETTADTALPPADGAGAAAVQAVAEQAPASAEPAPETGAEGGRRRGRGRDRARSERAADAERTAGAGDATQVGDVEGAAFESMTPPEARTAPSAEVSEAGASAPSASDETPGRDAATDVPARPAVRVEPYVLPLDELQRLAEEAGLHWAHSDPDRIAAAQAAIAAQPAPVHVPRERRPAVVIDEGPLVLVETRKDLSQVRLPFET